MDQEICDFKENVDSWIKKINTDLSDVKDLPTMFEENVDNTQHNYELLVQLREDFDEIKREIKVIRVILVTILENYKKKGFR